MTPEQKQEVDNLLLEKRRLEREVEALTMRTDAPAHQQEHNKAQRAGALEAEIGRIVARIRELQK